MRPALLVFSLVLGGCSLEQSGLAVDGGDGRDVGFPDVGPRDAASDTAVADDGGEDAGEDAAGIDAEPMDGCMPTLPPAEACDGIDNDCDPLTIDGTGDPGLGAPCDGDDGDLCLHGTFRCTGSLVCDDDATSFVEGCDNVDDDCDTRIDEGVTRGCSTACGTGMETCMAGDFVGCTAPMPVAEECNNRDDDCNGTIDDGIAIPCMTACGSGFQVCTAGSFGPCSAPSPGAEACSPMRDEDCDGAIDEGTVCGCNRRTFGGRVYQFCNSSVTWLSAVMYCSTRGYNLVTVNDSSEDAFLDGQWPSIANNDWWIGANDRGSEGSFVWVGGGAVGYNDWDPGEPNDIPTPADCASIEDGSSGFETRFRWGDRFCDDVRPFVCEGP
jgi:hypothetical protein